MTDDALRIGWVGAGFIGQVAHMVNYRHIPDARIVALAELRPRLGEQVCSAYGIARRYDHHKQLLEDPEVDAVVAVVHRRHTASVALDVLRAGKHLFTEKPMAQTAEQSQLLAEEATRQGVTYAVGFMRRHDRGVQMAKRKLAEFRESGELGRLLYARCYLYAGGDYCNISGHMDTDEEKPNHQILPMAPDWLPQERHRDFEHFVNLCSHNINLVRFLFDETPRVDYVRWRRPLGTVLGLDFDDFPLHLEEVDLRMNDWHEGLEVVFEKGRVTLGLPPAFLRNQPARLRVFREGDDGPLLVEPKLDWTWAFFNQDRAFVEDVRERKQPLASGLDSLEDMRLIEEIWRRA